MKTFDSRIDDAVLYQWGTEELTFTHQEKFIKHFTALPGKILEIGSGHGIMLQLFHKKGIPAYGLDLSKEAVSICRAKGLDAVAGDAITHLKSLPSDSVGGIFCAHVIEHLQPLDAFELISQSFRVLKQDGKILFITPNAKDLRTTERFWLDVTHVRPYPEKLMHMLLKRHNFSHVESFTDVEPSKNVFEKIIKKLLSMWFMGYMFTGDLVVIAKK